MSGHGGGAPDLPPGAEKNVHRRCVRRAPYRFISGGSVLTWERRIPGDSRVEQITCDAAWFYAQMRVTSPGGSDA